MYCIFAYFAHAILFCMVLVIIEGFRSVLFADVCRAGVCRVEVLLSPTTEEGDLVMYRFCEQIFYHQPPCTRLCIGGSNILVDYWCAVI